MKSGGRLTGESLKFYAKHRLAIDAAIQRMVRIVSERIDPGACPHSVGVTVWNCVKAAIDNYFRSGQTAGMVVGNRISILIVPHAQGVALTFSHVMDTQVLVQGPRVRPSVKRSRKSAARLLSDAFSKFQVNHEGPVQEIMISSTELAKLRDEKPGTVVEGEILGIPYKLIGEGESLWVR